MGNVWQDVYRSYANTNTILYKGLENPQILVLMEGSAGSPLWIPRNNCINRKSNYSYCKPRQGGASWSHIAECCSSLAKWYSWNDSHYYVPRFGNKHTKAAVIKKKKEDVSGQLCPFFKHFQTAFKPKHVKHQPLAGSNVSFLARGSNQIWKCIFGK